MRERAEQGRHSRSRLLSVGDPIQSCPITRDKLEKYSITPRLILNYTSANYNFAFRGSASKLYERNTHA